jgi:hypothetical protein
MRLCVPPAVTQSQHTYGGTGSIRRQTHMGKGRLLCHAKLPNAAGGYGGNANESPRYSFEFPTGWKAEVPSKVKGLLQAVKAKSFGHAYLLVSLGIK